MKFEYDDDTKDTRTPIAALYLFDGGPDLCLAIKAQSGKTIWIYKDGLPTIQTKGFEDCKNEVKRFYSGDKITITF